MQHPALGVQRSYRQIFLPEDAGCWVALNRERSQSPSGAISRTDPANNRRRRNLIAAASKHLPPGLKAHGDWNREAPDRLFQGVQIAVPSHHAEAAKRTAYHCGASRLERDARPLQEP